jgi:hypothetical protein
MMKAKALKAITGSDSRQHGTVPMRHIPIDSNDYNTKGPQLKEFQRYAELRKEAAEGKIVTLQGHFKSLTSKGEQAWGARLCLKWLKGEGSSLSPGWMNPYCAPRFRRTSAISQRALLGPLHQTSN